MKEQARSNQQHVTIPHDLTIVGLQSLYDQKYLTTSRLDEKQSESLRAKIGAWLLTIYDIGVSWIGGYVLSASLLSWVPALLHPAFLIACIITGLFQAALSLGSNIGDAQSSLGVWLFPEDKEVQDFKKRLEITKAAYDDLTDQLKSKKFSQAQLRVLLKLVHKNNEEIKALYSKIQARQNETVKYKIAKYVVLGLSSALHFGGGFILGKGLLGLIGLVFVPTPVTIAIGVLAGGLALTSFLVLKRHIIIGNFNRLLGRPGPLVGEMSRFIIARDGLNKLEASIYNAIYKNRQSAIYKNSINAKLNFHRMYVRNALRKATHQPVWKNKTLRTGLYQACANDHIFFRYPSSSVKRFRKTHKFNRNGP